MGNAASAAAGGCAPSVVGRRADPAKELLRLAEAGDASSACSILVVDARYLTHASVFGGNTAWHKAAKAGRVAVLDAMAGLITRHFDGAAPAPASKDVGGEQRACMLRLGVSARDVIKRLINKPNLKGATPLMLACAGCHTDAVAWLLKHGADVWRHDRIRRHTALHCAAEAGATDAIRLLLASAGTAVHPSNNKTLLEQGNHAGLTPLHYACYADQGEVLRQLLAAGADVCAQAEYPDLDWGSVNAGDSGLHIAANRGNVDAITAMLRAYNERSGSLLPGEPGAPRRLRDPRAMRNDYGRLPYHLAMRKGFTWLAELLDPSVPIRYLMAGEPLDVDTTWGPPRLATIAASVLHTALVGDLNAIRALEAAAQQQADAAAAAARAAEAGTSRRGSPAGCSPRPLEQGAWAPADELLGGGSSSGPTSPRQLLQQHADAVAAAAEAGDAGGRRRWGFAGHRRSHSGGSGTRGGWPEGVGRLGRRPGGSSSAGSRVASRRSSFNRGGGSGGAEGGTAGPLSPRLLMSVVRSGGSSGGAAASSAEACPGGECAAECLLLQEPCEPGGGAAELPSPSPSLGGASGSWVAAGMAALSPHRRPSSRQLPPVPWQRQQQQQLEACDADDGQQQLGACGMGRCGSGSCTSVAGGSPWPDDCCSPRSAPGCCDAGGKVSPLPGDDGEGPAAEGAGSSGGGVVDVLLRLRLRRPRSSCGDISDSDDEREAGGAGGGDGGGVPEGDAGAQQSSEPTQASPAAAPAAADGGGCACSSDGEPTCAVCMDAEPTAHIVPCSHSMCASCALDMVERFSLAAAVCPFCRCVIRGFAPGPGRLAAMAAGHQPPAVVRRELLAAMPAAAAQQQQQ